MTTINRKELVAALKTITPAIGKDVVRPTLLGVHVDLRGAGTAVLTCTNLDLTISTTVDVEGTIEAPLVYLLPAATLSRLVGSMRGQDVVMTYYEDRVTITSDSSTAELIALNADGWPDSLTRAPGDELTELSATDVDNLARVMHARTTNEALPPFYGVHLAPGVAQATDSYRGAHVELAAECPDITVPGSVLASILSNADGSLELMTDGSTAQFSDGRTTWRTRLVSTPNGYPDFTNLLKLAPSSSCTVQSSELLAVLGRMSALGPVDQTSATRLTGGPDGLVMRRTMPDVGMMEDCIDCAGDLPEVGINPARLIDAVMALGVDEVTIEGDGARSALVVRGDGGYVAIIMPIAPVRS